MAVEQIVVEFVPDFTQLDTAFDKLAASGQVDKTVADSFKKTTQEIQAQSQSVAELKRTFDQVKAAATVMGKGVEQAFEQGVTDALNEAGVSAKEFNDALNKQGQASIKTTQSLRQELKALTASIAQAKANGGPIDPEMIQRAGELKDAIADANAEIKNAGSDTRNIDNVVGSLQALAGGFAVAQGAAALLGSEDEDLQKTLVKVNGAIALSTGLQQILNAVQKEGALAKLADTIATKGQAAAQTIYTAVTGRATAATVAFKVALAATGIGLFVVGIIALVNALSDTQDELANVNFLIETQNNLIESQNEAIGRNTDLQIARAEAAGKAESELIRIRGRALNAEIANLETSNRLLAAQREQLSSTSEAWFALNSQIEQNNQTLVGLNNQVLVTQLNLQRQVADEAKKASDDAKERAEKAAADAKKRRDQELQNRIDIIQKELIEVEKGGAAEINVRQRLIIAQAALEIAQAEGNQARINLVVARSLDDRYQLQVGYLGKVEAKDKESRERILAELDKYIQQTNDKLNAQVEYEQRLLDARTGVVRRSLERIADNEKKSVDERISALGSLERYQLTVIDKQIANVQKLLISEEERVLRTKELEDQREKIIEDTEERIKEIRKQSFQELIAEAKNVSEVFANINQLIGDQESARLQEQRAQLDALIEAGALTDKQAQIRTQQLELAEKQAKQRAAVRDKQIALFQAAINGAAAIVEAAPDPFRIALTAALVASQIALIAARPIPRFATGKKGRYAGPGVVGEAGAELVVQNGRMWVANKSTQVYLGANDKVYTPGETKRIMQNVDASLHDQPPGGGHSIDYDKLGSAVGRNVKGFNVSVDRDFIREEVAQGFGFRKYFNKRYSSK